MVSEAIAEWKWPCARCPIERAPGIALLDAEAVARELAKLTPLQYAQRRQAESKRLGVTVKDLDEAVRRYRGEEVAERASLLFPVVEPMPGPG